MWSQKTWFNRIARGPDMPEPAKDKDLPPAAQRALAEADARRRARGGEKEKPREQGGPKGAEPTRYGDWERNGRAVDF